MGDIQEHKVQLREIIKGSEGELIILQDFNQTKENLVKVADKYKNLVVTKDNFEDGKKARMEIREMRYGLQNIAKHNNSLINQAKSEMKEAMDELIEILKPTEDKIDEQIKSIENEKKIEKERKEREEQERIAKINKEIADVRVHFEKLVSFGRTDDDVKEFCQLVDKMAERNANYEFQEFGFEIENLLEEYNGKLQELRDRVEQIKQDQLREQENKRKEKILNRQQKLMKAGLVANEHGGFEYKGYTIPEDVIHNASDESFEDSFANIEQKINDDIQLEQRRKADEEAKLKAEREALEKEKAEFEAKKKAEAEAKSKAEREQKEAEEKAKAELERKKQIDKEFNELMEKCKGYGITLADVNTEANKEDVIKLLKQKIQVKEIELTEEKKKALKEAGAIHIEKITPFHKQIFDYFGGCKILPEHETAIVEFEDELRASFKKLKKSIS